MLQHGLDVWKTTKKLICGDFEDLQIPQWFVDNHHWLVNSLEDWETIQAYTLWHDCGKPFCLQIAEDGKQRFPNHAEVSEKIFNEVFPGNIKIGKLIGLDMLMHSKKFEDIEAMGLDNKTLITLLVTAFAEINSNAALFGGHKSDSFKIKYKKLDKLGKKLITRLSKHEETHMYVLVRNDIPNAHKVVQAGHAIYEMSKTYAGGHPSFVVLGVEDEASFRYIMPYLVDNGVQFKVFREPMDPYCGEITAICTVPLSGNKRKLMSGFKLLNI